MGEVLSVRALGEDAARDRPAHRRLEHALDRIRRGMGRIRARPVVVVADGLIKAAGQLLRRVTGTPLRQRHGPGVAWALRAAKVRPASPRPPDMVGLAANHWMSGFMGKTGSK